MNDEGSHDAMTMELEAFAGEEAADEDKEEPSKKRVPVKHVGDCKKRTPLTEIICGRGKPKFQVFDALFNLPVSISLG